MNVSYRIDPSVHSRVLRSRLELLDQPGPQLPVLTRSSGLEVQTDPRTGATRVRRPGQPWLSID